MVRRHIDAHVAVSPSQTSTTPILPKTKSTMKAAATSRYLLRRLYVGGIDMMANSGEAIDLTGTLTFGSPTESGAYTIVGDAITATFTIDTNATLNVTNLATNNFKVGANTGGNGTLIQNAGSTFNFTPSGGENVLFIGIASGTGVYTMNGGTLNMGNGTLDVGDAGAVAPAR